jgi:hypothetical protein
MTKSTTPLMPSMPADEALRTIKLRCGYIINFCKDVREMRLEAEEMLRVVAQALTPASPQSETRDSVIEECAKLCDETAQLQSEMAKDAEEGMERYRKGSPERQPAKSLGVLPAVAAPSDKLRQEWREWLAIANRRDPDQEVKLLNYRDFKALLEAALPHPAPSGDNYEVEWADRTINELERQLRIARKDLAIAQSANAASEQEPVAWRYRLRGTSMAWKYVDRADECNPLDSYEREPVYGHPWAQPEGGSSEESK